jgi:hypothetical protein
LLLSDFYGDFFCYSQRHSSYVFLGEVTTLLPATQLARSISMNVFSLKGDALLVIFAVNQPSLFASWHFASIIDYISVDLSPFQTCNVLTMSKYINFCAQILAK